MGEWRKTTFAVMATAAIGSIGLAAGASAAGTPSWKVLDAPRPPGMNVTLAGVSCPSTNFCMAVGSENVGGYMAPVALTYDGSAWTLRHPVDAGVPDYHAEFTAVSCVSSTDCTVVGDGERVYADNLLVAEHWDGVSWSVEQPVQAPGAGILSVACGSPTRCIAVGVTDGEPLAEEWRLATGWTLTPVPAQPEGAVLTSVSCVAINNCYAVGDTIYSGSTDVAVIERFEGRDWFNVWLRKSNDARTVDLTSISCSGSDTCSAAGTVGTGSFKGSPVGVALSRGTWSLGFMQGAVVAPGERVFDPVAISCASLASCVAVGNAAKAEPRSQVSAYGQTDTGWSAETVANPNPVVSYYSAFNSVSCPTSTDCIAVGERQVTTSSSSLAVIEQHSS